MANRNRTKPDNKLGLVAITLGFLLSAGIALWTAYQTKAPDPTRQELAAIQISQLKEAKTTPSQDLKEYLDKLDEYAGCDHTDRPAMHQLRIEYKNYAKIKYGCGETDATMYLKRVNEKWQTISPTNQFVGGIPLCSHIKKHDIPLALYGEGCFQPENAKKSLVTGQILNAPY